MKYQGQKIFTKPPQACNIHTCDCPYHGFGIATARAQHIWDTLYQHGDTCRNEAAGTVDYAKFMAGPELDLHTPAELLYAGHCLNGVIGMLEDWEHTPEQQAKRVQGEFAQTVTRRIDLNGGSMAPPAFGRRNPSQD